MICLVMYTHTCAPAERVLFNQLFSNVTVTKKGLILVLVPALVGIIQVDHSLVIGAHLQRRSGSGWQTA